MFLRGHGLAAPVSSRGVTSRTVSWRASCSDFFGRKINSFLDGGSQHHHYYYYNTINTTINTINSTVIISIDVYSLSGKAALLSSNINTNYLYYITCLADLWPLNVR